MHPGIEGHSDTQMPSSSRLIVTENFICSPMTASNQPKQRCECEDSCKENR
jgi:hypothetical protein